MQPNVKEDAILMMKELDLQMEMNSLSAETMDMNEFISTIQKNLRNLL